MQKFVCLKETNKCKQPKWKLTEYLLVFLYLPNGLSGNLNITQNSSVFVVVDILTKILKVALLHQVVPTSLIVFD